MLLLPALLSISAAAPMACIVITGCGISERTLTERRIGAAAVHAQERGNTDSCIGNAGRVLAESIPPVASVFGSGRIVEQRTRTVGGIERTLGIVKERIEAVGRVVAAGRVVHECVITQERVAVDQVAAVLTNGSRLRRKR